MTGLTFDAVDGAEATGESSLWLASTGPGYTGTKGGLNDCGIATDEVWSTIGSGVMDGGTNNGAAAIEAGGSTTGGKSTERGSSGGRPDTSEDMARTTPSRQRPTSKDQAKELTKWGW